MKMTKEKHLELVSAWWDKRLEVDAAGDSEWRIAQYPPEEDSSPAFYRIRPQPKLRPWRPEEVPVGALIRSKLNPELRCVIVASGNEVLTVVGRDIQHFTFQQALDGAECSLDCGSVWKPCGVEESQ